MSIISIICICTKKEIVFIFLIKGKYDLFIVSAAIKEKELPEGFIKEWTEVFKNSKLHN